MASYEEYKEKFKDLATQLRVASSSLDNFTRKGLVYSLKPEIRDGIIDLCASLEDEIKTDIAERLKLFETYKDLAQIEKATFLGMARDTVHLAVLKTIMGCSNLADLESFANGSIENLIFATDLMICERDGKSKWSLYDDVH